jgi:N-acetylglutamate synthase-like GNAT family acetyltransferase
MVGGEPPREEGFQETFRRSFLPDSRFRFAVVEGGGRVVGCCSLHQGFSTWRGRPTVEIQDDFVLAGDWKGGAHSDLIRFAEGHASDLGAIAIFSRALPDEEDFRRTYLQHGFTELPYVFFSKLLR